MLHIVFLLFTSFIHRTIIHRIFKKYLNVSTASSKLPDGYSYLIEWVSESVYRRFDSISVLLCRKAIKCHQSYQVWSNATCIRSLDRVDPSCTFNTYFSNVISGMISYYLLCIANSLVNWLLTVVSCSWEIGGRRGPCHVCLNCSIPNTGRSLGTPCTSI